MFNNYFKKIVVTIVSLFLLFSLNSVSAEFKSTSIKSDSIDLSWDPVEGVFIYKVNYGTDSSTTINYDKITDYIDKTTTSVFDLTPGTKYYFTVVGYDDLGNEKYKSSEISATTSGTGEKTNSLYLEDSNMVGLDKVELTFSNEINALSAEEREFRIENIGDSNDILEVLSSEVSKTNSKNLVLTLDKEPKIGTEYKVIVLNIRDIYNQNIEFGVDSEATFIGVKIDETMINLNAATENTGATNTGTSSSGELIPNQNEVTLGGVDLNSADVNSNVLSAADDTSKLPTTGPEEILIFILAFIVSGIIFAYRFRKI
ncbi:MAG: fibronectin type III domain-containing protein [Candidatus Gracilibacteria bacterium]|nr:fibronectin type III domain-containing protein [Candidatus Gracilibacteria bacterium]